MNRFLFVLFLYCTACHDFQQCTALLTLGSGTETLPIYHIVPFSNFLFIEAPSTVYNIFKYNKKQNAILFQVLLKKRRFDADFPCIKT